MGQPATPIRRREELFNRIVRAIERMPEDLQEVFVKTRYQGADLATVAAQIGLTENQLVSRRQAADDTFRANLEGRRLRLLR